MGGPSSLRSEGDQVGCNWGTGCYTTAAGSVCASREHFAAGWRTSRKATRPERGLIIMRTLGRLAVATMFLGAICGCTSEPDKGPAETAGKKIDDAAAAAAGAAKDAAHATGDAAATAAGAVKDAAKDAAHATGEAAGAAADAAKDAAHGAADIAKDAGAAAKDAAGDVAAGAKDAAKDAAAGAADAAHTTGRALDKAAER
jgi:hypothetical protein